MYIQQRISYNKPFAWEVGNENTQQSLLGRELDVHETFPFLFCNSRNDFWVYLLISELIENQFYCEHPVFHAFVFLVLNVWCVTSVKTSKYIELKRCIIHELTDKLDSK